MTTYTQITLYIHLSSVNERLKIDIRNVFIFSHNFISNIANLKMFAYSLPEIIRNGEIKNNFFNFEKCGSLGEKFCCCSPKRLKIQSDFNHRTSKGNLYSVRASKRYINAQDGQT